MEKSKVVKRERGTFRYSISMIKYLKYPLFAPLIGYFVIFIFFGLAKTRLFLSFDTVASILNVSAELGIIALGVGFLMIAGEFDLSVGSIFAFSSMLFAILANAGLPCIYCFFLVLATASSFGLMNGFITTKGHIPSFITTLGTMMLIRGIMLLRSAGWSVRVEVPESIVFNILSGDLIGLFLRKTLLWFVGLAILLYIILDWTKYGNHVFATGGNKTAAKNMGINTDKVKIISFMMCGLFAGIAGSVNISRFRIADPTLGSGMELEAITSAVVGGILLTGGYGNIIGALIGAILIATIRSGLIILGVPGYFYTGVLGVVLIMTTLINNTIVRKTLRREIQ